MHKHRVINGFDSFEVFIISVLIGVAIAMAFVGIGASIAEAAPLHGPTLCGVEAANAGEPHNCLVTQCAKFGHCESFVIAAHPQPGELREATATHMVEQEICILSTSGNANNCMIRFAHKGDQIIAWHS